MVALPRLLQADHAARQQPHALMLERGLGYWITPDGQALSISPGITHADMARQLFANPPPASEDHADQLQADPNAFAIAQGWTRVRIYPADRICYADLGHDQPDALQRVHTLLNHIGLPDLPVKHTDPHGNYVS
jgi:hypothetical protein